MPLNADDTNHREYLLDMIEQLAEMARQIGEIEVAIHLDAIAEARRHRLEHDFFMRDQRSAG